MEKRNIRMLTFLSMVFVFFCLLLSGGSRLIAGEGEESMPVRPPLAVRAALVSANAPHGETDVAAGSETPVRRVEAAMTAHDSSLKHRVQSDANGNILAGQTYMRAVYQVFALGDGFV